MRKMIIPLALGLSVSLPTMAVNWSFLKYSAVSQFTEQDWELLRKTGREALDNAPDGDTRGWNNPETGAFGTIQPLHSYQDKGLSCRRTEVFNNARSTSGTSRFDFCKQKDGSWKVASPKPKSPSK